MQTAGTAECPRSRALIMPKNQDGGEFGGFNPAEFYIDDVRRFPTHDGTRVTQERQTINRSDGIDEC